MPVKAGVATTYKPDRQRPRRLTKAEPRGLDDLTDAALTTAESDPDNLPLDDGTLARICRAEKVQQEMSVG